MGTCTPNTLHAHPIHYMHTQYTTCTPNTLHITYSMCVCVCVCVCVCGWVGGWVGGEGLRHAPSSLRKVDWITLTFSTPSRKTAPPRCRDQSPPDGAPHSPMKVAAASRKPTPWIRTFLTGLVLVPLTLTNVSSTGTVKGPAGGAASSMTASVSALAKDSTAVPFGLKYSFEVDLL
jgi:hypothetical protein